MPGTCLHLTTGLIRRVLANIKVFKCKILGSNNDLNACESLQMSGEILHFIFIALNPIIYLFFSFQCLPKLGASYEPSNTVYILLWFEGLTHGRPPCQTGHGSYALVLGVHL